MNSQTYSDCITVLQFNKTNGENSNYIAEEEDTGVDAEAVELDDTPNIACFVYSHGKLGAAYYNFREKTLNVYEELVDMEPLYLATLDIYEEVKPKLVLSFGHLPDQFIQFLIDLITGRKDSTLTSDSIRQLPQNLVLLPLKEYTYEICDMIICQLELSSYGDELTDVIKELNIKSLISFDYKLSIQAVGTVVKYLEKNWTSFNVDKEELIYLHLNQVCRKSYVLVEYNTFQALQIFSKRGHDSSFKRGLQSASREGLSIFKMFSTYCKSKIGMDTLKNMLTNPIKNIDVLNQRLDFIEFCLKHSNRDYVESLQDNIKQLGSDIDTILKKIVNARANNRDWYVLYKTIYHMTFINDISAPFREKSSLLMELNNKVTSDLIGLHNSIEAGIDFNAMKKTGRPTIRFGLDETLDTKKLRQQDIAKDITAAARFAANSLPDFLNECSVVYLPEMGHLIAIKEWEPGCNPEQIGSLGYHFMFTIGGTIHYKNALCAEMDKRLGDINAEIIDHENRILRRLGGFVVKHNMDIREPFKIIGLMDSLIAMSMVAIKNSYVRPKLNENNIFEIVEGKHALMEHMLSQFQSNNFYSGGNYSHMKIITGPNGSGKTLYLRQIALLAFLAHVGSFIPAESANIPLLNSIHSRMHTTEAAAVRMSSFMLDVSQVTRALKYSTPSSLILIDEFGRGTTEEDSVSILGGMLMSLLQQEELCPHILVSTHVQQIVSHLPCSPLVEFQKMEYAIENGVLYFLFKVAKGVSRSFAIDIAESLGFNKNILDRARQIKKCLEENNKIPPLKNPRKIFESEDLRELSIPKPDEDIV